MACKELCYKLSVLPDLSLNKYASLDGNGVDGVLEKHLAFLRQWNRKGVLSDVSIHLFYYFDGCNESGCYGVGEKGNKLEVLFMVCGEEAKMKNVPEMVSASTLSDYFRFIPCKFEEFLDEYNISDLTFSVCSTLLKKEVFIRPSLDSVGGDGGYYTVPQWEMNEDGRLYNMLKLMESLDKQMLYRIDLYPTEISSRLREILRRPMTVLRERQYSKATTYGQRDFEAENVLKGYEDLLEKIDSSPHFAMNAFVFGHDAENTAVVLDAAGAEALMKGSYEIASFNGRFKPRVFWEDMNQDLFDRRKKICAFKSTKGLIICKEESREVTLNNLPTLCTLEEVAPFFRFPTLYEGETVQKRKETAPKAIPSEDGLYLGTDNNGYPVYFPLENLPKHAFIAGVPGSGKTITMSHITSSLWKNKTSPIPFLVLEPAKQEYRALANEPGMEDLYLFSPNADMSFPLHINPFEFPKGLILSEHIRRLCSVFEGAFPLDNPMPFLLDTAIEAVYRDLGWTPETVYTSETKLKFPTVSMLYKRLEDELETTTYSEEIRGNLESALKVRIGSLLRREMGDVFDVPKSTIPPERWLEIPAVIELESMGTGPANFMTLMLCTLIREALKVNPHHKGKKPRHVIFIEEAHNLIGPESEEVTGADANPKQAATAFVVKMLAEVRALKEGIVIADQLPTVMAQEVLKNTGLKIGLRITSADDRGLLGSTMAANSMQLEEMATFEPGQALISYEGLMKPFKIRTHKWRGPVGEKHCQESCYSEEWCREYCPHYREQTCIPEEERWKAATTPKNDVELIEIMKDRKTYREICEQSFVIEATRFHREYGLLSDRVKMILDHIKKINEKDLQIKKLTARLVEMTEELIAIPEWQDKTEQTTRIQRTADYIGQEKMELKEQLLSSQKFRCTYDTINDCILFVKKVEDRKKHWKKLGIPGFVGIGIARNADYPSVQIQKMVAAMVNLQGMAIMKAQQLFIRACPHLANPQKVRDAIVDAVTRFRVENIMPK